MTVSDCERDRNETPLLKYAKLPSFIHIGDDFATAVMTFLLDPVAFVCPPSESFLLLLLQPMPSPQRSHARQSTAREPLLINGSSANSSPDTSTPRHTSRLDTTPDDRDEGIEAEDEAGEEGARSTAENDDRNEVGDGATGALSEPEFGAYSPPPASDYDLPSSAHGHHHHHHHLHEAPAETAAHRTSGYSSDTSRHDMSRRAVNHAQRPFLSFGGATATTRRPGDAQQQSTHRHRRSGVRMRTDEDPLIWTGGSPATQAISINGGNGGNASSFGGLPPLLAGLEGAPPLGPPMHARTPSADATKVLRCSSYCCALGIDLMLLYRRLSDAYGLQCRMHKDGLNAVLHCTEAPNGREGGAHSFFFSYGCVVTWGLSEAQEQERLQLLTTAGCAQELLDENEVDDFGYTHQATAPSAAPGSKPGIAKDVVYLSTLDLREKLAISFALAQSVKLGVFERTVEETIQETREIPERMAVDGRIRLTRKTITKRIGQLFVDRASINLHSDILDHPEFFWEDDEWLPLYLRASKYLEIDRRAEVLNKRLDIIKELFDMLANELNVSHSNKLEWIIIILIVLEVVFQVLGLVLEHGSFSFGAD